jgi:NAD-dependent DNA ligase
MLKDEYFVFTETLTTMLRKQAQSIITGLKGYIKATLLRRPRDL